MSRSDKIRARVVETYNKDFLGILLYVGDIEVNIHNYFRPAEWCELASAIEKGINYSATMIYEFDDRRIYVNFVVNIRNLVIITNVRDTKKTTITLSRNIALIELFKYAANLAKYNTDKP